MSKDKMKAVFNTLNQVKFDEAIRAVESITVDCNKLLCEFKDNGLGDFLTFDIALSIIKNGREGIATLTDRIVQEAQKKFFLTKEKKEVQESYTAFFAPYQTKVDWMRRPIYNKSEMLNLDLFVWNDDSKEIGLIRDYKAKIEPLYTVEAKEYHYTYLERLNAYVEAKNELLKYHALVYAHDFPSRTGIIRARGDFSEDEMLSYNYDTREYSPIELDKLLLTSMHEPDSEELLKKKYVLS
ncbi:hypothetical protein [Dysgonomonas sp.]|uniref:hypothetical protein n=1 Tax=Dysgonomonas sp. TaxID=1891233 RepID=UPI0028AE1130|nr:hypothetical protein [Dysgonomonas sp.]